ncbi:MAG: hypothetical protein WAM78_08250 [Candidatus Sulfotelmatobacter sp.]
MIGKAAGNRFIQGCSIAVLPGFEPLAKEGLGLAVFRLMPGIHDVRGLLHESLVRFAGEYLAERPIDVVDAFLHELLLHCGLWVERHEHERLQSIANVVIHEVDESELFVKLAPGTAFI